MLPLYLNKHLSWRKQVMNTMKLIFSYQVLVLRNCWSSSSRELCLPLRKTWPFSGEEHSELTALSDSTFKVLALGCLIKVLEHRHKWEEFSLGWNMGSNTRRWGWLAERLASRSLEEEMLTLGEMAKQHGSGRWQRLGCKGSARWPCWEGI